MGEQSFIFGGVTLNIDTMTISDIWKEIEKRANDYPEYVENINASYIVKLSGEEKTTYSLIFKKEGTTVIKEELDDADCVLSMNTKSFKKLLQGNLNTTAAFMSGKLKVKGNIGLALKLEEALKKFQFGS